MLYTLQDQVFPFVSYIMGLSKTASVHKNLLLFYKYSPIVTFSKPNLVLIISSLHLGFWKKTLIYSHCSKEINATEEVRKLIPMTVEETVEWNISLHYW